MAASHAGTEAIRSPVPLISDCMDSRVRDGGTSAPAVEGPSTHSALSPPPETSNGSQGGLQGTARASRPVDRWAALNWVAGEHTAHSH
jgi:hypothetical protein